MLQDFQALERKVAKIEKPKKVAVIKAASTHALEGVFELADQGMIIPYLIDNKSVLQEKMTAIGIQNFNYHIIDVDTEKKAAIKGIELVRENKADFIVKGNIQTGTLLREVVNRDTGIREKEFLSHLALIDVPAYSKLLGVTDGGMLLTPDVEQKEAIIENASEVMNSLGYEKPKFAILSASEVMQPKLPASTDADELSKRFKGNNDCIVEGPISLDLALSSSVAEAKAYPGKIQGDADVLISPDVVAGNTLSKSMLLLAHGTMAGIILGAKAPIVLTSRSSSAAEIKASLLVALQVSESRAKSMKGE